ncbi:MAG: hypothetical protein QOD03_683 [Verrucomicrobiota bacterium]|jgi:hypothetical protein
MIYSRGFMRVDMQANHALQQTRHERRGCNPRVPCAGLLRLSR